MEPFLSYLRKQVSICYRCLDSCSLLGGRDKFRRNDKILSISAGVLLALSYPVSNLGFLAFVAFVPLFFAIRNLNLKQAFSLSYICGVVFFSITIYWLVHVTLLGLILLVLYLSLYFGLFGIFFKLNTQYSRLTGGQAILNTITLPAAWVLLEYLRSTLITGFPWALLGYSQYLNLPIIQIADITGVWGVSFLVMLVNFAIYRVMSYELGVMSKKQKILFFTSNCLLPFLLLFLSLGYGFYKLSNSQLRTHNSQLKISIIQGNIPQHQKWDKDFRNSILERYEDLTKEAARDNPDLIIWPETSAPGVVDEEPELLARVLKLAKDVKAPLLIGAVTSESVTSHQSPVTSYYNSAILISPDGKILNQYNKLHLVPFGEYVPLERYFPFLRGLIGVPIGDFTPGQEYTVFKLNTQYPRLTGGQAILNTNFSVLICFEDILPELSRRFVREGAQFLVNITNDAWFMASSAPYQHVQASVFRAIENRVPVVRAANTGVSCFIDATGRIYDKVRVDKKDIFVVGYKTQIIHVSFPPHVIPAKACPTASFRRAGIHARGRLQRE